MIPGVMAGGVRAKARLIPDPHWSKVVSLMHFDGGILDETGRAWSNATSAAFSSGGVKGSQAIASSITTPYSTDLDLLNEDFTIEFFVNASNFTTWGHASEVGSVSRAFGKMTHSGGANYWSVGPNASGRMVFYAWNNGSQIIRTSIAVIPTGTLTHVSIERHGNTLLASTNGSVEVLGTVGSINLGPSNPFALGRFNSVQRSGLQDELRVTKGVARYTENFIPPAAPFPNY